MRLVALLEEENIVTSPFVLLSEEETLLAITHSSVIAGINVKMAESGMDLFIPALHAKILGFWKLPLFIILLETKKKRSNIFSIFP